jgi:WD40 repeat protein/serine/threonine protein kinase
MSDVPDRREQDFADLLAVYDDALATGSSLGPEVASSFHDVPAGLMERLETAKECLVLLESMWPRSGLVESAPAKEIGRFQIVRELGRGGFGIVFLAYDPQLSRQVALKVPQSSCLLTLDSHHRFLREAEAAARLSHSNIVTVYEVGHVGAVSYIAAEYCLGPTLTRWQAAAKDPVPVREAVQFVAKLALAMQHAHDRGVLHRDLNPNNILLDISTMPADVPSHGRLPLSAFTPKISDFGLAKILEDNPSGTRTGTIFGTLTHMAPEQAEGRVRDISVQTDVYALGVILYELLCGEPPHQGKTSTETLQRILLADPKSPRQLRPELARDLAAICLKCLEKHPARRYASAAELADDVQCFLDGHPTLAVPLPLPQRCWRWTKRRPALAAGLGVSMLAVVTLLVSSITYQTQLNEAAEHARREASENRNLLYTADVRLAHEAREALNGQESLRGLAQQLPGVGTEDRREFAWKYLWNAAHTEVATLTGHRGDVYFVAFSPDGRRLASAGKDRGVRVWNIASQELMQRLDGHRDEVNLVGFVGNDTVASASDDGTIRLWNVATGQTKLQLDAQDGAVRALAIAPNLECIASGGTGRMVHLWNPATGQRSWSSEALAVVESLVFSPDGQTLVAGFGDGSVRWWDVVSRQLVHEEQVPGEAPVSLSYSNDFDQVAAVSRTGRLCVYVRVESKWMPTTKLNLPAKSIGSHGLAFSPRDNSLAIGARDGRILFWRAWRGLEQYRDSPGHSKRTWSLAWSPSGCTLASGSADGSIKLWNVLEPSHGPVAYPSLAEDRLTSLAVGGDGDSLVTVGVDGHLRHWDRQTRQLRTTRGGLASFNQAATFLAGSTNVVAIDKRGSLRVIDLTSPAGDRPLLEEPAVACSLTVSTDQRVLAVGFLKGSAAVYDALTGRLRQRFRARALDVKNVALSSDGDFLATSGVGPQIELWDTRSGELKHVFSGHDNVTFGSVFTPDGGSLISSGSDEMIRVWDVASGRPRGALVARSLVVSLAVSPDGRTLASGSQEPATVKLWDLATHGQLMELEGVSGPIHSLAFSRDGRRLFGAGFVKEESCSQLLAWSLDSDRRLSEDDEPAAMLSLQSVAVAPSEPKQGDATEQPTGIAELFQAASSFAVREGFATAYPLLRSADAHAHTPLQMVCVRGTQSRTIWIPINELATDGATAFRCDYGSQNELYGDLVNRLHRWSKKQGYSTALPTFRGGPGRDGTLRCEATLLWGEGCVTRRFKLPKTTSTADLVALFPIVHDWAVQQGYVSGFPAYSPMRGQVDCILFHASRAEIKDFPPGQRDASSAGQ